MQTKADIILQNNIFFVEGDLNFANVMSVYQKSLQYINQNSELSFDFSRLKSSDSSGLALIVEWLKLAKQRNRKIQFSHLSADLQALARAAGLESMNSFL